MALNCSQRVAQLQSLKDLQAELNQNIEGFLAVWRNEEIKAVAKAKQLSDIYQMRKDILKSDLFKWRASRPVAEMIIRHSTFRKEEELKLALDYIEEKVDSQLPLTRMELIFIYEPSTSQNSTDIKARCEKLKQSRDVNQDLPVIFDCDPKRIIHNESELRNAIRQNIDIKVYSGDLFVGMFQLLPKNVEWVYSSFPEGQIMQKSIKLGTGFKDSDDFVEALAKRGKKIVPLVRETMDSFKDFWAQKESELRLIIMSSNDLGFGDEANINDVFRVAESLDLKKCPPEAGPQLFLQCGDMVYRHYIIDMDPFVTNSTFVQNSIDSFVFDVTKDQLTVCDADINATIRSGYKIVFCV